MIRVENLERPVPPGGEPVEAIVALADESGARLIADDVRAVEAELSSARYRVAIVAGPGASSRILERILGLRLDAVSPATSIRYGRGLCRARGPKEIVAETDLLRGGVCFVLENAGKAVVHCVLTARGDDRMVADAGRWQGLPVLTIDTARQEDIDKALAWIANRAVETGASRIEDRLSRHVRYSCARLKFHLGELAWSLGRTEQELRGRVTALRVARACAEAVFELAQHQPDDQRDALAAWLAIERTKFLMGTKADALVDLDQRIAKLRGPRHDLRQRFATTAHTVLVELLTRFWRRIEHRIEAPHEDLTKRLIVELELALGDLGESFPLAQAMSGLGLLPVRALVREIEWPGPAEQRARISDHVGFMTRRRSEQLARDSLVEGLSRHSTSLLLRALESYDANRRDIEDRFRTLIVAALQSLQVSARFASRVSAEGVEGLARGRHQIDVWSKSLAEIAAELD